MPVLVKVKITEISIQKPTLGYLLVGIFPQSSLKLSFLFQREHQRISKKKFYKRRKMTIFLNNFFIKNFSETNNFLKKITIIVIQKHLK